MAVLDRNKHLIRDTLGTLRTYIGLFLLFPQTFKVGGAFLITHSLITIICYVITKDLKGGLGEFVLLQVPIFLIWSISLF